MGKKASIKRRNRQKKNKDYKPNNRKNFQLTDWFKIRVSMNRVTIVQKILLMIQAQRLKALGARRNWRVINWMDEPVPYAGEYQSVDIPES